MGVLDLLDAAVKRWSLELEGRPTTGPTGLVALARRRGAPVVLKIPLGDEARGAAILEAWEGAPVARVLESIGPMHLQERLEPGTALGRRHDDPGDGPALALLAETAAALFARRAALAGVPDAIRWGESLLEGDRPDACEPALWRAARGIYADLAASQGETALLHGDLHHGNLLWDRRRGWVAIDPKGVVAEREFEHGCMLRNPLDRPDRAADPGVIADRLALLVDRFGLDRPRLVGWAFAQAVLSAAWSAEDAEDPAPSLAVARAYRPLLV
jgi:streptomycin 6-kinase